MVSTLDFFDVTLCSKHQTEYDSPTRRTETRRETYCRTIHSDDCHRSLFPRFAALPTRYGHDDGLGLLTIFRLLLAPNTQTFLGKKSGYGNCQWRRSRIKTLRFSRSV